MNVEICAMINMLVPTYLLKIRPTVLNFGLPWHRIIDIDDIRIIIIYIGSISSFSTKGAFLVSSIEMNFPSEIVIQFNACATVHNANILIYWREKQQDAVLLNFRLLSMTGGMLLIWAFFIFRTRHTDGYPLNIDTSYVPFDIAFTSPPYTAQEVVEDSSRMLKNPFDYIFRYLNKDYNFTTTAPGANARNITRSTSEADTSPHGASFNGTPANSGNLSAITPTIPVDINDGNQNRSSTPATEKDLIQENKRRCEKLATDRFREACRSIVEETFANTDYAYVLVDDEDLDGLKKELTDRGQRRAFDVSPILPGIQGATEVPCPTRSNWNDGTQNNQRSLSPWTFRQQYDPDR